MPFRRPDDSRPLRVVPSIHDVMPHTLGQVRRLFDLCREQGMSKITLLVVPGLDWDKAALGELRSMIDQGARPAGHGWLHETDPKQFTRFSARLHSRLISRTVAEHLALDQNGIRNLIKQCHDWFAQHDLPNPELYVPPAWAMGTISRSALDALPFHYYESLMGVYDVRKQRFLYSPMLGYEADSRIRALVVASWNRINLAAADTGRLLRIGLHPNDLDLHLARNLRQLLTRPLRCSDYSAFA